MPKKLETTSKNIIAADATLIFAFALLVMELFGRSDEFYHPVLFAAVWILAGASALFARTVLTFDRTATLESQTFSALANNINIFAAGLGLLLSVADATVDLVEFGFHGSHPIEPATPNSMLILVFANFLAAVEFYWTVKMFAYERGLGWAGM